MGKDYGEPIRYDPDFNGPIHNRSCTDILFLIAFVLFLGVWGFIGYYGIQHGDIDKLLAPMDSEGHRCGLDSHVQDKGYLVFFDITKCLTPGSPITGCPTKQVCVSQCPTETHSFGDLSAANFNVKKRHMVCDYDVDIQSMTLDEAIKNVDSETGKCAPYVVKSQSVLSRCIGDLSTICKDERALRPNAGATCERYPREVQKSLMSRATALDSYVGWIAAGWVTFFTKNERDTHIVCTDCKTCTSFMHL